MIGRLPRYDDNRRRLMRKEHVRGQQCLHGLEQVALLDESNPHDRPIIVIALVAQHLANALGVLALIDPAADDP
jgi:hypothetical protein